MPTYTYRCRMCGTKQDRMRAMVNMDKTVECSHCGGKCERIEICIPSRSHIRGGTPRFHHRKTRR
jgi:putative FmdB family regulatory protein